MKVFAKFDEIPSKTLQDIKETKRYGHTFVCLFVRSFGRTDGRTTVKQYTLPQTQFAGGIINKFTFLFNKMILLHKYGHLSQMQISISLNIMLYEHDMLNKNNLMMVFTAMYFSCSVSVDNIASDSIISLTMCLF